MRSLLGRVILVVVFFPFITFSVSCHSLWPAVFLLKDQLLTLQGFLVCYLLLGQVQVDVRRKPGETRRIVRFIHKPNLEWSKMRNKGVLKPPGPFSSLSEAPQGSGQVQESKRAVRGVACHPGWICLSNLAWLGSCLGSVAWVQMWGEMSACNIWASLVHYSACTWRSTLCILTAISRMQP